MKSQSKSEEYDAFADGLRKVLRVSHSEMKAMLDAEKKEKKRKRIRRVSASRASGAGR